MTEYLIKRLIALLPVLLIVGLSGFLLINLIPGDPVAVMLGPEATQEDVDRLRHEMGLDLPLFTQLIRWYSRLFRGDLGYSIFLHRPVLQAIRERLEPTLLLTFMSLLISTTLGISMGILAAVRRNTRIDQLVMSLSVLGMSIPSFWLALIFIQVFAVHIEILPVAGYTPISEGIWQTIRSLFLPALTLGFIQSTFIARMTRSSMLEVLSQDYIRTAKAKGLTQRKVIYVHALRNAFIPIATVLGLVLGSLMSGAVVVETVFALPGVGQAVLASIARRDYPMVQGILLFIAFIYVFVNFLVDILYVALDPRVKYV
ncbi:MAG: Glutathione transport system permease protein GsiC [candidate division WS2 bacterium]|uniref:Glutathione transport system permease protein GsiC n=1 Tax=Psychracetigena formicireducens TaxID=2986056 RepID=A0A9E2BHR3_PSYF1|nr:Glutathione transport system permease protein GsiC [Candidatus Psychracetigena formicireducens]MBT9151162.1 Glutathione transport system permease protein GsiC [Candidatus Psychracetigena formicireducens]